MQSEGWRRSTGIDNKVEIERLIKTPGTASLVITTSHKDDVTVMLSDKTVIRHGDRRGEPEGRRARARESDVGERSADRDADRGAAMDPIQLRRDARHPSHSAALGMTLDGGH